MHSVAPLRLHYRRRDCRQRGCNLNIFKREEHHPESAPPAQTQAKDFMFGEPNGAHETVRAKDRDAAVWRFLMKVSSLWDYVPERYRKTDLEGHWIGHYDSHTDMFIPEYTADACIPVYVKEKEEWKLAEKISPYTVGK